MPILLQRAARRPHGHLIVTSDCGQIVHDTKICCHCQHIWKVQPGSGIERGFCQLCDNVTCGAAGCQSHLAFQKKLELYEAGILKVL